MRGVVLILCLLLAALQYELWYGKGGIQNLRRMEMALEDEREEIERLKVRNRMLAQEIADLKEGLAAVEERARSEMGMIKEGEIFYQILEGARARAGPKATVAGPTVIKPGAASPGAAGLAPVTVPPPTVAPAPAPVARKMAPAPAAARPQPSAAAPPIPAMPASTTGKIGRIRHD
jgi:cell division protein FtsB